MQGYRPESGLAAQAPCPNRGDGGIPTTMIIVIGINLVAVMPGSGYVRFQSGRLNRLYGKCQFEMISLRNALLCTTPLLLCLSLAPASAQPAISTPILASAPNFRDVAGISAANGGTGFTNSTANNGVMRTGVFYRTDVPALTAPDQATVTGLRIVQDIDLRTPAEIAATPDSPFGAAYININIYGSNAPPQPTSPITTPQDGIAFFQSQYKAFVADPNQRAAFHDVLVNLAHDSGAALFHCSGGKDRTGWTAAMLESIAGVSPTTIMNDYMATNRYTSAFLAQYLANVSAQAGGGAAGAYAALVAAPMAGVDPSYLQTAFTEVTAAYGSMNAFLLQGLGLSQADIYVLRAKMVNYPTLPGQPGLAGNAANGAALLNALQNSPLSGAYTAYNYYLQSAIDAGTLGGVPAQVGGQVHADAAAFLLRQPSWIEAAIAPYTTGRDLGEGQNRIWMTGLGGYFASGGRAGIASSSERNAGPVIGATRRIDAHTSASLAIGYDWGSVGSAGGNADVNTLLASIGGRYGFSSLDAGPFVAARVNAGWVDYRSQRALGGGLGTAQGNTSGAVFSGRADVGDVLRLAPFTVTLQGGVRVAHVGLNSFNETGSELALGVAGISRTSTSLLADVEVALDRRHIQDWTIEPAVTLGYEQVLGNPQTRSTGTLYGFSVNQYSASNASHLLKAGVDVTAQRGAFNVRAGVNAVLGDGTNSSGVNAHLSLGYSF